jgi:hypothetical protein
LSRGGCHNRWRSLANCNHRDPITSRACTAAAAQPHQPHQPTIIIIIVVIIVIIEYARHSAASRPEPARIRLPCQLARGCLSAG